MKPFYHCFSPVPPVDYLVGINVENYNLGIFISFLLQGRLVLSDIGRGPYDSCYKPAHFGLWCSAQKLAKFDSSQVYPEMPCFKRQKSGQCFALDSSVPWCVCVWYFYLVILLFSWTAAILSICYAGLSSAALFISSLVRFS